MTTYSPAYCMNLRSATTRKMLRVILAADGTPLESTDESYGTLPRWVLGLAQIPEVEVRPGEWRKWAQSYPPLSLAV
jgi:hypothetical protein